MKISVIILIFIMTISIFSNAQDLEEEVVVTGIRASADEYPGVTYTRKGDFLLLKLLISNDTRDEDARKKEIFSTLKKAIQLSEKDSKIELSVIQNGFVIPLTEKNHKIDLDTGSRPDTSEALIRVKTTIPSEVKDPEGLIANMKKFAESIPVSGRVEIEVLDDIDVSIVNPSQYRSKILKLVTEDIKDVTTSLGEDYRVVLSRIDGPVQWVKSGSINLTMYINYSYTVIPENISTVITESY